VARRITDLVQMRNGGRPVEIAFHGGDNGFSLPAGAGRNAWSVEGFTYDERSGRFAARIDTRGATDALKVSGRAHVVESMPVLRQRVAPGETITRSHVEWRPVPAGRFSSDYVDRLDDLIGMSPKRALGVGQPVRAGDLGKPEAITKNSLVTMIAEVPGLSITTSGRAVEGGGLGDVIQVMNLQSKKIIQATVTGSGQVRVVMAPRLIVSN